MKNKKITMLLLASLVCSSVLPNFVYAAETKEITTDGTYSVDVETTNTESFVVTVPKAIAAEDVESIEYSINVKGDIAGMNKVSVVPNAELVLSQASKDDVTATVTQEVTDFISSDIAATDGKTATGTIAVSNLTAGEWAGNLVFNIKLKSIIEPGLYEAGQDQPVAWDTLIEDGALTVTDGVLKSQYSADDDTNAAAAKLVGELVIPDTVTSIETDAFCGCTGLTSVTIPESVTTIGDGAFYGCSGLTKVDIPNSVTDIGVTSFTGCSNLSSIRVDAANTTYDSRNNCNAIIETASNTLLVGCKNTIIPDSVTSIGEGAFEDVAGLKTIDIPTSVNTLGVGAFSGCEDLVSITIPEGVTKLEDGLFYNCPNLKTVNVPTTLTEIGEDVFYWDVALNNINLPEGLTTIGAYAFTHCFGFDILEIPESVTTIGEKAFENIAFVKYIGTAEGSPWAACEVIVDTQPGLYKSGVFTSWETLISNGTITMSDTAISKCNGVDGGLIIPEGVTALNESAFANQENLTAIKLPSTLESLGKYCLSRSGINSVRIPEGITTIGSLAFWSSTRLRYATLPSTLTTIESYAFDACTTLQSIVIPEGVTTIGEQAFLDCIGMDVAKIPDTVTTIGDLAFRDVRHIYYNGTAEGAPWGAYAIN